MSEERAVYHITPAMASQPQPVDITLNAEQVRGIIHSAALKSPGLIVTEALKVLERDPDIITPVLLSESAAQRIFKTIFTQYPAMAQKVIADIEESANG